MVLRPRGRGRVGRRRLLVERPLIVSQRSGVFHFGNREQGNGEQEKCNGGTRDRCEGNGTREQFRLFPVIWFPRPCQPVPPLHFPCSRSPFPVPEAFFRHASRAKRQRRRKAERR